MDLKTYSMTQIKALCRKTCICLKSAVFLCTNNALFGMLPHEEWQFNANNFPIFLTSLQYMKQFPFLSHDQISFFMILWWRTLSKSSWKFRCITSVRSSSPRAHWILQTTLVDLWGMISMFIFFLGLWYLFINW